MDKIKTAVRLLRANVTIDGCVATGTAQQVLDAFDAHQRQLEALACCDDAAQVQTSLRAMVASREDRLAGV